ncbi:hypothetical protein [Chamaesiphon sp. OTE_75_metabat_556]|nr:hypothetical protein [Chamaesiphon sp. OTE_75_metabat_556]
MPKLQKYILIPIHFGNPRRGDPVDREIGWRRVPECMQRSSYQSAIASRI